MDLATTRPVALKDCAAEMAKSSRLGFFLYDREDMACNYWQGGNKMMELQNPSATVMVDVHLSDIFLIPGEGVSERGCIGS